MFVYTMWLKGCFLSEERSDNSSAIRSASMAIFPRTAYSMDFRLGEIVSIVSRLVRVIVSVDDVVADVGLLVLVWCIAKLASEMNSALAQINDTRK